MQCKRISTIGLFAIGLAAVSAAGAQEPSQTSSMPTENVRYDYAQVLAVHPVYETTRTTSTEKVCDPAPATGKPAALARVVNAVRDRLSASKDDAGENCRMQPVTREVRRIVAYDVDYMYRGTKFRTRMDSDPGYRLRIRIAITPHPVD
jgi:uncharacterized protein YcfJ